MMDMHDMGPEAAKLAPGIVGSLIATLFLKDTWLRRIAMFLAGAAFSRFGSADVARWTGGTLNEGFAGFLLGLFGMAIVQGLFEWLRGNNLAPIFTDWLRRVLGLPPAPAKGGGDVGP